ncbi:hypothetical protein IMSAGC003_00545 [Lachnospiraceae bacterium]|uniref:DUF4304 domain-containing protein n=1 Tax=Acetatifactor muris TaxID=879566 RepID=A0A2K4ZN81_9FIRM|nr:hypothetical protein [Acetatifactor muris]MCR2050201.1 hypothetical protein [Acetatifactor muris]GFH94015.1 hypothetical protein IMSAGC003_00545 [Lachnospiraceae bacterium]SOY31862.1 hypothetical protein AMURIS_04611 [Acetatifactor muris]
MTFFEQELQKLFGKGTGLSDVRIVGNACYGRLSEDVRVKIHFTNTFSSDNYDALKVVLINRREGPVDSMVLHFSDLWGSRKVNNPNFRDGVCPHIWKDGRDVKWYAYKPTEADYRQLSGAVRDYLDVFREPALGQQMGQKMC